MFTPIFVTDGTELQLFSFDSCEQNNPRLFPPAGIEADGITSWIDDKGRPCSPPPFTLVQSPHFNYFPKRLGLFFPFFYSTKIPGDIGGSFREVQLPSQTHTKETDGRKTFEKVVGNFVGSTLL